MFLAVIAAAIVGNLFYGIGKMEPSRLSRLPRIDSTPGGARQAESEHYRQTLMDANSINAERASEAGESFISIPEALPEQIARDAPAGEIVSAAQASEPPPDPVAAANNVLTVGTELRSRAEVGGPSYSSESRDASASTAHDAAAPAGSSNVEAILNQMSAISRGMAVSAPGTIVFIQDAGQSSKEQLIPLERTAASDRGSSSTEGVQVGQSTPGLRIPAGTIFYGEPVATVSSDLPSPIVVEITTGPLAGSRLVGGFAAVASAGGLAIEFSRLATVDGVEVGIEAIAIDGFDSGPSVASEVRPRLIERYGPGLLTSLVAGFAESASRPDTELIELGSSILASTNRSTKRESVIAGVGRAAERLAADMASSAPTGPEIVLRAGYPVGILFLTTAVIPN